MELISKAQRLSNLQSLIKTFKERVQQNSIKLPKFVKIVELGPRDGLQNEKFIVPTEDKISFINRLSATGLKAVETTSFVSPKWVPQMGDNSKVFAGIQKFQGVSYPVLVPNVKGLESALEVGVKEIAIFGAASESFTKKNINCTIEESLEKFRDVCEQAKKQNIRIRGYVSTVMGCPYEGEIDPQKVAWVTGKLFDLGCYEVSLGDTIGVGTPEKTQKLLDAHKDFDSSKLAVHFHDTYDRAIQNLLVALEKGIAVIDSSVGGLGGCPYAKTNAGNVCTENVVYTLHELGIETGINLQQLSEIGNWMTQLVGRQSVSVI